MGERKLLEDIHVFAVMATHYSSNKLVFVVVCNWPEVDDMCNYFSKIDK